MDGLTMAQNVDSTKVSPASSSLPQTVSKEPPRRISHSDISIAKASIDDVPEIVRLSAQNHHLPTNPSLRSKASTHPSPHPTGTEKSPRPYAPKMTLPATPA
jgi:hypothetical protein